MGGPATTEERPLAPAVLAEIDRLTGQSVWNPILLQGGEADG